MKQITVEDLKKYEAREFCIDRFKKIFGDSVSFETEEEAVELAVRYADKFNFRHFMILVFGINYPDSRKVCAKVFAEMWFDKTN